VTAGSRPGDRDLPLDAHLHTRLSPDADADLDAYAAMAVERGVAELAITDHLDFEPGAPAYGFATFSERERVVREAAERWADRVAIRFGVEITYQAPYAASQVGAFVAGRSLPEILEPYFGEVLGAARSGLFDALGHLDFVKRYLVPHVQPELLAEAPELYEPILAALVGVGTGLEINTSGLRQAAHETYPAPWAVARFRELGGRRITIGSDAHRLHSFGAFLGDGYRLAASAGYDELHFRRGSEPVRLPLAARHA
jgi:histidinol-phosphatase (PHP family)